MLNAQQIAFLEGMRVARLSTVDINGEAYIVPICYVWHAGRFYSPIDEKPKRSDRPLKRTRNVQERGRASLLIDHYTDEDWAELAWLMIRGNAWIHEPGDETHKMVIGLLRQRYVQYQRMELESAPLIVLEPDRVTDWGALTGPS